MRFVFIVLFIFCFLVSNGQKTESTNKNIFCTAMDTLISVVLKAEQDAKIVISCDDERLKQIPDSFHNIAIYKTSKFKPKCKFEGFIWLRLDHVDFYNYKDSINFSISIRKQENKRFPSWQIEKQISSYELLFKYDIDSKRYILRKISNGYFIY